MRESPAPSGAALLDGLDVLHLRALRPLRDLEADLLILFQRLEPASLDRREMREQVLAAAVGSDEAEPLRIIEPLYRACSHCSLALKKLWVPRTSYTAWRGRGQGDAVFGRRSSRMR